MTAPKKAADAAVDFDLTAAREAALSEPSHKPFRFQWGADVLSVSGPEDWPLQAQSLMGEGKIKESMELLLGPDQWDQFMALRPTMGDVTRLLTAVSEWAGFGGLPNSSAPQRRGSTRK